MAQSMQEIVRTEAGIEPSDRGDGSVSHLFTAGGLTVQACAQPSTGDALRNQAQPAQRLHVFSYCIEHRSCGRARIRSNVEYMVGVLCLLGRFSGMVGPRRTSARQPARRSIGGQLVYAPSRGRVLRKRDRSTLRACLLPTLRLRRSGPAPRPQPREAPAGDTRAQEPATCKDRHRAPAASERGRVSWRTAR